jgi:hypothetical protein
MTLSPREAVRRFAVSRATLMKHLKDGTISGAQDEAGTWRIDAAELVRVYQPRADQSAALSRSNVAQLSRTRPVGELVPDPQDERQDLLVRLARAEAERDAERAKVELLERHLADVRRLLPSPDQVKPRRRWWPFS